MNALRPPANLSDLQRRIERHRRQYDLAPDRLHQRIGSELFFGVLTEAKERGIIPMFLLKGGMAMELRFGMRARASGDVDVGILAPPEELLPLFDRALAAGFAGFTFRRKREPIVLQQVNTYRLEVQIAYRGRPFNLLSVDLNEASYESASEILITGVITELGLPGPLEVPVLERDLQIAQKLHAVTEPSREGYVNNRYRDLIDILIFRRNVRDIRLPTLRRVAVEEFARRRNHRHWPPVFSLPKHWVAAVEQEAKTAGLDVTEARQLEDELLHFIASIEGIDVKDYYQYRFLSLQLVISGVNAGRKLTHFDGESPV